MYLILQHGKVASQTIEWSIRQTDETARVERHHYLSEEVLNDMGRICALGTVGPSDIYASSIASMQNQMLLAQKVRGDILNSDEPVAVLSGFRDPLDLAISAFFQNITDFCPWLSFDLRRIEIETKHVTEAFNNEFDRFLKRISENKPTQTYHELVLNLKFEDFDRWFGRELLGVLGVNVFDHEIGIAPMVRFCEGRFTVLLYRVETLRQFLPELLRQLPLPREPVVSNQNIGSEKIYGPLYERFRAQFVPSDAMVDYYYGGQYFKHFYSGLRPRYSAIRE